MGNLFTTLHNSTNALRVFERSLQVTQNNIVNSNTPGYARQDQVILSLPFQLEAGLPGGILAGDIRSARSEFLEQTVRTRQEQSGYFNQRTTDLGQVEPLFDITSRFGIPVALNNFFNSFSELSVNPNDVVARQNVIELGKTVAESFHQAAVGINQTQTNVDHRVADAVSAINRLGSDIAHINSQYRDSGASREDAGLATDLNNALEELAGIVNFTLIKSPDGSANVYLGGEHPLVIGDRVLPVQADFSTAATGIRDEAGNDITAELNRGQLGALLDSKNTTLPGYLNDLHTLAKQVADVVNAKLSLGRDLNGAAPTVNLFSYQSALDAAFTLDVTAITPQQIAAALPAAPGGNGNALALAAVADQAQLNGFTFTEYFGNIGARVGRDLNFAKQDQQQFQDALLQSQAERKRQSGVDLDEEATKILQFQKSYQAVGKLIEVVNGLTDTVMDWIR